MFGSHPHWLEGEANFIDVCVILLVTTNFAVMCDVKIGPNKALTLVLFSGHCDPSVIVTPPCVVTTFPYTKIT